MTGLRRAVAVLAVAAAGLVTWQKHLLTDPGPGLLLVLACALPFVADACWPRPLRPGWPLAAVVLVVAGSATALLARVAAGTSPGISVPAGVLVVALPHVASQLGGSHTPPTAAIGTAFAWVAGRRTLARRGRPACG